MGMRLPTVLGTRLEDFATLSYNLPMLLLELNSLSANEITWTSLNSYCSMNFIHILVVICVAQYTWFVCLSTRSEGRTWYTTHRGRLWIAATVKKPDPEEIRENEEFYRRLYGGSNHIMCTFTPSSWNCSILPSLPSWNGKVEWGTGNGNDIVIIGFVGLSSCDIAT